MIVVQTTAKTIHFILFVCRSNLAIHLTEIGHLFFSQEMICSNDKEKLSSIFISEINLHEFNKKNVCLLFSCSFVVQFNFIVNTSNRTISYGSVQNNIKQFLDLITANKTMQVIGSDTFQIFVQIMIQLKYFIHFVTFLHS